MQVAAAPACSCSRSHESHLMRGSTWHACICHHALVVGGHSHHWLIVYMCLFSRQGFAAADASRSGQVGACMRCSVQTSG